MVRNPQSSFREINDSEEFTYTNPVEHKKQIEDFKAVWRRSESQLSFLIVKDMR